MKYFNKLYLLLLTIGFSSCYEDYVKDNEETRIYFTMQNDVRSFIVDEDMDIQVGPYLSGIMDNKKDRVVKYELDNTLLTPEMVNTFKANKYPYVTDAFNVIDELKPLPTEWYTLSNNDQFVIKKGMHAGFVSIESKDDKILSDANAYKAHYALPFKIVDSGDYPVTEGKDYIVVALKYECRLFGYYYQSGVWDFYNANGEKTKTQTQPYKLPMTDEQAAYCVTVGPYSIQTDRAANNLSYPMNITLNKDNTINLSVPEGKKGYTIEAQAGECKFNNAKLLQNHQITLKYKLTLADNSYVIATDTLTFRNRIRDGVNEYQDENPEHYK